jgi:hypothetical protein
MRSIHSPVPRCYGLSWTPCIGISFHFASPGFQLSRNCPAVMSHVSKILFAPPLSESYCDLRARGWHRAETRWSLDRHILPLLSALSDLWKMARWRISALSSLREKIKTLSPNLHLLFIFSKDRLSIRASERCGSYLRRFKASIYSRSLGRGMGLVKYAFSIRPRSIEQLHSQPRWRSDFSIPQKPQSLSIFAIGHLYIVELFSFISWPSQIYGKQRSFGGIDEH